MGFSVVLVASFVIVVIVGPARPQITSIEAECLTAEGSAGQCMAALECPVSSLRGNRVMCRYSRGRGLRICCPRPLFISPSPHHSSNEREDFYIKDDPIAFPSEYKPINFHQHTTNPYNSGSHFIDDSNHRPLFNPSTSSFNRPVYGRPSYESNVDHSFINQRPHYSEQPTYSSESSKPSYSRPDFNERPDFVNRPTHNNQPSFNERPAYIPDSKPSFSRPDYNERPETSRPPYNNRPSYNNERPSLVSETSDTSFGKPSYNERPGNANPSYAGSNQGRPNVFRPEPDVHGSSEGSAWDFPTTRRPTTPRPTWAVDADEEPVSSNIRRISEQKCEEYSMPVTETLNVLPLSLDSEAVPLKVQKCDFSAVQLIVGGETSALGEFPHMAALGFPVARSKDINWSCGGTLISEEYVLTAGHCVNTSFGSPVVVRLGEHNLAQDNDGAEPQDYRVNRIIVHPKYRKSLKYDDIALLRLSQRVQLSKWIRPACLNSDSLIKGSPTATGWGRTDYVGKLSDSLMKVNLNVIDNRQCNSLYNRGLGTDTSFSSGIVDTMLCAGVLEGGRDSCLGDSGGPLTITKKDNPCIHYVVGITSFGKVCGAPNSPGVYTRVSKYISWIERTVWPNLK